MQIGITYRESMAQGSPVAHAAGSDPQVEIVMGRPIGMTGVSAARLAPCAPAAPAGLTARPATRMATRGPAMTLFSHA